MLNKTRKQREEYSNGDYDILVSIIDTTKAKSRRTRGSKYKHIDDIVKIRSRECRIHPLNLFVGEDI